MYCGDRINTQKRPNFRVIVPLLHVRQPSCTVLHVSGANAVVGRLADRGAVRLPLRPVDNGAVSGDLRG